MDTFIPAFLAAQEELFRHNLSNSGSICSLRSFTYEDNKTPDYTHDLHKQLYYLRYASAYIIEYYLAYQQIFETNKVVPEQSITTLSIGCGAMLDLIGFDFARRQVDGYNALTPRYYGVDLVDWQCHDTKIIENIKFFNCGIEDLSPADDLRYRLDILFFPKSASEIPYSSLDAFVEKLDADDLEKKICIVNSRRGSSTTDGNKVGKFCDNIAKKCGYRIVTQGEGVNVLNDPEEYLSAFCPGNYWYERNTGHWLNELVNIYCAHTDCDNDKKELCCKTINRWPTLKVKHISPEIYHLEKI